jgi:hypothetical protein
MAIEDYIPNVFGQAPMGYEGLLGAERTKTLQNTANLQGLLGAAGALAQGMSGQGGRRSAIQNILGAIGGGIQGSQGAYQQGLQQYSQMQQIEQAKIARDQATALRTDVEKVMRMPEVASNPALVAALRADPAKALQFITENMGISQAYAPSTAAPSVAAQPEMQGQAMPSAQGEQVLPPVEVVAQGNPLLAQKERLMMANSRLTGLPGDRAQKAIENNLKQIENIDKQIKTQFDIEQKQKDYTNEARRVAAGLFPNMALEDLNQPQLTQLQTKLDQLEIAKRKAGATTINMPSESERTAGFLTNRVQNSLAQLQAAVGQTPSAASPNFSAEVIKSVTGSEYLKNLANPEARQQVEAAQLEILDAALTLGTGAAYTREQLDNYRRSYFPQLNDKPATVADKAKRLKNMLDSAMIKAGRAAPTAIPQVDIEAAIRQELDRRKGK